MYEEVYKCTGQDIYKCSGAFKHVTKKYGANRCIFLTQMALHKGEAF